MRKTVPIIISSLLMGLTFDWLFYSKLPGISVFIYTSLILGFTFYLSRLFKKPLNTSIYWLTPALLFFSLMVFIRANLFLAVMNIFIIIYLFAMVARLAQQPALKLGQYEIFQYVTLLTRTPLSFVREFLGFLLRLVSNRSTKTSKSSLGPIVRGLLLSLPILAILVMLLSSADLVFKQYIGSIFNPTISPETVFRWGLIGFVTSLFIGAYALIFMPGSKTETDQTLAAKRFGLGTTEASVILGSVSLLFFAFIVIQLTYLFGGSDHIASTGHTYAEYARKGFFELIAVAAISLLLILTIKRSVQVSTISQRRVFKWLSGILIAEVMVIMLSAHMRLNLYQDAYGFTTLRLLSHLFILWLACAFLLLIFHIVRDKSADKHFALQLFISFLCFFALINIINPDNFIARQNINRFNKTGKLDLHYLSSLSEDAVPAIAPLLDHSNKDLQKSAANILYIQEQYTTNDSGDWQSANLSRQRADRIFRDKAAQIEAAKTYDKYPEFDAR